MYYNKYNKYKTKYLKLKRDEIQQGGKAATAKVKKCSIDNGDKILFGSGGSTAIIIISASKQAYKIFITYLNINNKRDNEERERAKIESENTETEIAIYKNMTKNIVDKGISRHFVRYIADNDCDDVTKLFAKCPNTYTEFLKINKVADKTIADTADSQLCSRKFWGFPDFKLGDKFRVIEIEYCNYSCADFIRDVSQMSITEMEKYLDIFFFQIIYTIVATQMVYPFFLHRDLFMRNILGTKEKDNGNYYTYAIRKKIYKVPQKLFFPKISDFGMTNLDKKAHDSKLMKSTTKDAYNIVYDIYNGGNLGARSLSELCKDDPDKISFLKEYFGNYFNVTAVDEYRSNSAPNMNWDWNSILDSSFANTIGMREPEELLDNYFYNIFAKINAKVENFASIK